MTKLQAWLLHLSVIVLTVTGVVFAWMKYWMKTDDPFAVANHPAQPHMLHIHVIAAPVGVFALGLIYMSHIWMKYRFGSPPRRKSGVSALLLLAPMILSGYFMQVVTSESLMYAMKVTHWISSGLFVVVYLVHQIVKNGNGEAVPMRPPGEPW